MTSPWLLLALTTLTAAFAQAPKPLDSRSVEIAGPRGEKGTLFRCKLPEDYGRLVSEAQTATANDDLGDAPPPPPPVDPTLCVSDLASYREQRARDLHDEVVPRASRAETQSIQVEGTRETSLRGNEEDLRLFKRLLSGESPGNKRPLTSGPASWPASVCENGDLLCTLTRLFDPASECSGDRPCAGREMAHLALNMAKRTQYFPTLTQWYPGFPTQRWDADTLRAMTHVFSMLPASSARFPSDKDMRIFPPGTSIGDCPAGGSHCEAGESWPVGREQSSTTGMAQISYFGLPGERAATFGTAYLLVTDRLVNADRMQTCKGLVHELAHHFDYSFMFYGDQRVRGFGNFSSLPVADSSGVASSFAELSWRCGPGGENCVANGSDVGFVSTYASQVGPKDDFAESMAHYICQPIELLVKAPRKYDWIRSRVFLSGPARDFWVPRHEEWPGFDTELARTQPGSAGPDTLLGECLGSFTQMGAQPMTWTSGPRSGQRFAKIAAYWPHPDPALRAQRRLTGYLVQDLLGEDVMSKFDCVSGVSGSIDASFREKIEAARAAGDTSRADPQYCSMGSTEAVTYLTRKRLAYVAFPFFKALEEVGLRDAAAFDGLSSCRDAQPSSCRFLQLFNEELEKRNSVFARVGLTSSGRARAVTQVLRLLRGGR